MLRFARRRAFTLVELLVVMAIIVSLIAFCCRPCNPLAKRLGEPLAPTIRSRLPWRR